MKMPNGISKVAHFGAYDHDSFGDLIFPYLVEHFLPDVNFTHVSPSGIKTPWSDAKHTISVEEAFKNTNWDGILIGGGDIVQLGSFLWSKTPLQSLGAMFSIWGGASLLASHLRIPCAWNSPGVPKSLEEGNQLVSLSIESVDYLTVRDSFSADRISNIVNREVQTIPDTALAISEVWKSEYPRSSKVGPLIISITPYDLKHKFNDIKNLINKLLSKDENFQGKVIILPLMRWQGNLCQHKIQELSDEYKIKIFDTDLTLHDCAMAIASGRAYVGSSLHGLIVALSYGLKAVHVMPSGYYDSTKYKGFTNYFLHGDAMLADSFTDAIKIQGRMPDFENQVKKYIEVIKKHFEKIRCKIESKQKKSKNENLIKLFNINDNEAHVLPFYGFTSNKVLEQFQFRISELGSEILQRTEWAQKLNEELEKSRVAVAQAQGEAAERTEWAQKLNEELEKSWSQAAELLKRLDVFSADNINLSEALSVAQSEINDDKRYISNLQAKLMDKEDQLKKIEADFYANQNKLASLESRLQKLHDETLFITSPIVWFKKRYKFISKINFVFQGLRNLFSLRQFFIFDPHWYLAQNADVKKSGKNPYIHYAFFGISENRKPNRRFRIEAYDPLNPDVKSAGMPHVLHYLLHGNREKRISNWLERYIDIHHGIDVCSRVTKLLDLLLYGQGVNLSKKEHSKKLNALISRLQAALDINSPASIASPTVSVIIPVYNQVFHTLACLISLFESAPKACFEVIIADDCSTDETSTIFSKFSDRIRVIRTPGNLGFLKNCNHAAKEAKGEFVVLLNNDMVLLPDWLDSLVATISKDSECGMVGSKLLNLDGTLQEAGGIFWKDGSAWNYGRGQNPMAPEFNYKKEVDYCSGASICLRKEVWDAVGGFDEIYAPAYCEESDLAFRLRARGLKTIYQPCSVGIHLEGVSCGTDTSQGIKAYQVENQKKLLARWSGVLKKEHFENGTNVFHARGRTKSKKSILIVDHYIPQHDRDAGSRTMLHIIERFLENGYNVIFWPENLHCDTKYAQHLQEMGVLVLYGHEFVTDFEAWFKANAKFLHGVLLSRPQVADNVINTIRIHSKLKVAFYGHDIHHLRLQRKVDMDPSDSTAIGEAKLLKEVEQKIWGEVDVIYYPSQDEVDYVAKNSIAPVSSKKIRVLPPWAFHDFLSDVSANLAERAGLLFVAGFAHTPNIEGALWFAKNVWPLVLTKYPAAKLTLAGSNPVPEITALRSDSVKVTGYIPDNELEVLYRSSRVSIAPLLHGAGVKGKVVEALKFGLPVVTTPTGAQGIPDSSHAIAVAESPEEMAKAILKLLTEDKLWLKQSATSLQLIKNLYSTDAMWEPMKDLF